MSLLKQKVSFKKHYLIILSSPSGGGKSTLCHFLLKDFTSLIYSISFTSRAPRMHEKNGVDYYFITQEEFEKKISQKEFAEWALVHNHYYGTSQKSIQETWNQQKSLLLDIDFQGAKKLKQKYPNQCLCFFIQPPHLKTLEKRLRLRNTDSEEEIQIRLKNAEEELKQTYLFDFMLKNEDINQAYEELKTKIEQYVPRNLA